MVWYGKPCSQRLKVCPLLSDTGAQVAEVRRYNISDNDILQRSR